MTNLTPVTYLYAAGAAGLAVVFIISTRICVVAAYPTCRATYVFDSVTSYFFEIAWAFVGIFVVWIDNSACSPPELASVLSGSVVLRLVGVFAIAPYFYCVYRATPSDAPYRHVTNDIDVVIEV